MRFGVIVPLAAAALLFAAPSALGNATYCLTAWRAKVETARTIHEAGQRHHRRHSKRKGCRLTHDGLVCGGGSHGGSHKSRHGNGHGGNRH
jgi:hypothetical protein